MKNSNNQTTEKQMPQSINGLWNWAKSSQEKKSKQPISIFRSVQHPQPLGKYELNLLWELYLTPIRWASSRRQMTTNTGTNVGREGPFFTLGGSVAEAATMEISVEVSPTAKYRATYHMTQLHHPLGVHSEDSFVPWRFFMSRLTAIVLTKA